MAVFQKSTGMFTADEIADSVSEEMNISVHIVRDVMDDLTACEILMDAHGQFMKFHALTCNPPRYLSAISFSEMEELVQKAGDYIVKEPKAVYEDTGSLSLPIFDILQQRHSCREFSGMPVEREKLFAICKASYSSRLRPTASAGALFPLSIYFINRIDSEEKGLSAGLYQYDCRENRLLLLPIDIYREMVQYALDDLDCIFEAPCIFFVCADLKRHMKKYANAGYRYTLLEAGHVVQNMTIAIGEMGLGGVEYGGYCDEAVKQMFQMPEEVFPLACYAVGYEGTDKRGKTPLKLEQEKRIIENIVRGKMPDMHLYFLKDAHFQQSCLRVIVSRFQDKCGREEYGTGIDSATGAAYMKSVMEAYERYALSCRYFDRQECADRLEEKYLAPQEYAPYSDGQREKYGLTKFRSDEPVEWVCGYDLEGHPVYVPADLCFDVPGGSGILYHIANSSGCAAHFERHKAEQAALLELIERDAIVKNWLYRQTPGILSERDMPEYIRRRLCQYQKDGVSIFILPLLCEYAYTVLVCSVNYFGPPYFIAGAGASFSSVEDAAEKAFDEWEVSFVTGRAAGDADMIVPEAVVSPKDHGSLYRCTNYNKEIEYLLHGREVHISDVPAGKIHISDVPADGIDGIRALAPVFVSYRTPVDGAYVVRAFSRELVPINFGYGMEFFEHAKVDKSLVKDNGFPHFFS